MLLPLPDAVIHAGPTQERSWEDLWGEWEKGGYRRREHERVVGEGGGRGGRGVIYEWESGEIEGSAM